MNPILQFFNQLPIRRKLTLWAAVLLFGFFLLYNVVQYVVINQWIVNSEEADIKRLLVEIQGHYTKSNLSPRELTQDTSYLKNMNQKNQLIRIVTQQEQPVVVETIGVSPDWIVPHAVEKMEITEQWHEDDHLLIARLPLHIAQTTVTIEVVRNIDTNDQLMDLILFVMVLVGIVGIVLASLGGMLVSRRLLNPIQELTSTMKRVEVAGLQERVKLTQNGDELSELSSMFNSMMDRLEESFQQQKQFVEDASHELRTPITIIEGHLSLLDRWGKKDPNVLNESLAASLAQVKRLKGLILELLELTRTETQIKQQENLEMFPKMEIEKIVQRFSIIEPSVSFSIELEKLYGVRLAISEYHFEQIMLILLDNAVKYSLERKKINISSEIENKMGIIRIQDYGIGIPEKDLPYIFDRFYRVDKARSREQGGSGLGLAIAKRLVELYKGRISVKSEEGKGTIFQVEIPIVR